MSSQRFNFNDDVSDAFPFSVAGLDYDMRYPTQDEMKPFSDMLVKLDGLQAKLKTGDTSVEKDYVKLNDQMEDFIYSLITPAGHEKAFTDTRKDLNVVVLRKLHKRLMEELLG